MLDGSLTFTPTQPVTEHQLRNLPSAPEMRHSCQQGENENSEENRNIKGRINQEQPKDLTVQPSIPAILEPLTDVQGHFCCAESVPRTESGCSPEISQSQDSFQVKCQLHRCQTGLPGCSLQQKVTLSSNLNLGHGPARPHQTFWASNLWLLHPCSYGFQGMLTQVGPG